MLTNKIFNASALATRLSRRADCSQQTCRLGPAGLLSLVATVKKIPSRTPKDTYSTPKEAYLPPERYILEPKKKHPLN